MVRLRVRIIALLWKIYTYYIIMVYTDVRDAFKVSVHGGSSNEHYRGSNSLLRDSPKLVRR